MIYAPTLWDFPSSLYDQSFAIVLYDPSDVPLRLELSGTRSFVLDPAHKTIQTIPTAESFLADLAERLGFTVSRKEAA